MAEPRSFAIAAPRRGSPILRSAATTSSWCLSATLVARRAATLKSVLTCRDSSLDVSVAEAGVEFPPVIRGKTVYRLPVSNVYPQLAPLETVCTATARGRSPL